MKTNIDLQSKALSKYQFSYLIYFYINSSWIDFSKYVYNVNIDFTDLKIDFEPSTATAKVSFYPNNMGDLFNDIKTAIQNKTLKCRIYLNSDPNELVFEGYIDYPTFSFMYSGYLSKKATIEFFDYTYILKTKKIGRVEISSGTAQGGTANTITLKSSDTNPSDFYNYCSIEIMSGTGITQEKLIIDYNGVTKVATVDSNWETIPDTTSVYVIKTTLKYINKYKCNNSDINNSMVHLIMKEAGFGSAYINVPNILNTVPVMVFDNEITCFQALKNLFQSELMIFDFYTGILRAKSIDTSSITPVMTLDNTLPPPAVIYGIEENFKSYKNNYKSIRATYDTIIVDDTIRVLFSLQEKDGNYKQSQIGRQYPSYKFIASGQYFPAGGNLITASLKFNEECDVIYASDISVEIETYESINNRPALLVLSDFQINGGEVKFRVYNNSTSGDYLLSLRIKGKAVYIKSSETIVEGDTLDGDSINIESNWFFTDIEQMRKLINFYKHSIIDVAKYEYNLVYNFLPQIEIGDIINFKLLSGDTFYGLVTGVEFSLGIDKKQTTAFSVLPVNTWSYSSSSQRTSSYSVISPTASNTSVSEDIASQATEQTLTELTQSSGSTIGGFTNIPGKINFSNVVADGWSITLSWEKQFNIANIDRYELQVSTNQTDWYSFSGVLNEYTVEYQTTSVFVGEFTTTDPPNGITYYFRLRQVTRAGVPSTGLT